uniref:Pentacotripeptide-repeat region of PRORP domain-containing protein n=1 Tax=Fagus sylvatica TaxID=28930 RepID=A0A2N9HZR6_FAGSY
MAVKLSPLAISKRIPKWVSLNAFISSVSCANSIEIFPENNQNPLNSSEFEQNFHFLRNKLGPDNLIRVLDNTSDLNSAVRIFKWASLQKRFQHNPDTYYWIILKLGLAGNVKEMEGFCVNMVKDRCPGVEEKLVALIDTFVRHGRSSEAIRVLVNMNLGGYKPSIDTFNAVLGAVVEEKRDFQDVMFVYKEIVKAGIVPTVDTLNHLLEALFETNKAESALDQFRRMNKKGCNPNSRTFEIVIKGLVEKNRVDEAVNVLGEMLELGCQPDLSFYTCTIPLFCWENKPGEGIRLFRLMRASNFVPDSLIYEGLIRCLCENLLLDDALNIFKEMISSDINPVDNVFLDIVNGLCKLGKINEAIKLLEDNDVSETSLHNILLEVCCSSRKFLVAKGLLEKMSERNIANCESWNILVRWLCENGAVFVRFSAKCWILDSESYSELVEGLCWVERTLEATEVFYYMSNNRCSLQSSSFDMLIKGICATAKVDQAIKLWQLAYYSGTSCNNATYGTIMLELYKLDKAKEVLVVFSQMLTRGCSLDQEVYSILIQSMSSLNRIKECVFYFNMMVNEGLAPDSKRLFDLLLCIANHSQLCMVSSAINELISNSEILNPEIYNILINGFWKEGNKREARRLLDLMLEKGWVPDATTHGLLVGSIARKEADSGAYAHDDSTAQDAVMRKGSDVGAPKGNDILQVITRGPRENHQIEEELHPQALVYRNLWLEAEAPMCALSMEF